MKRNLLFAFMAITGLLFGMASCQKAPELTLTSSSNIEFSADGSSGSITFTANRDWTARAYDSWVSVSPSSGTASDGPVTVTVRCNANTTYEDRSTTVTINMGDLSQTVSVKQPANKGIVLPKQVFDLQSDTRSIDVEVQANVQYSVSTSANWIKQVGTKALSSKTLSFSIEENKTYDPREGKITIKPTEGNVQEQVITVRQAQKAAMNVEKTSYEMPYGGGEIEIKVEANVAFTVTPNVDWLHYIQTKALTNSTVCIKVDENTTYSNREGKIEIAQQNGSLKHTITVKQAGRIAVTSVELNKTSFQLKEGDTETLIATVKPDNATDKTVTWSTSDASIASVDDSGKVTAVKEGTATITAKAGEKSATCTVTVSKNEIVVTEVTLNKTELTLKEGDSETLVATVKPDNATDKTVSWSSSDTGIAIVDANGKVTAVKEGNATITAKVGEKSASCLATVLSNNGAVDLGLSVLWGTCNLGASQPDFWGERYAWGESNAKTEFTWSNYEFLDHDYYKYYWKVAFTKYDQGDGKKILDRNDDAASVNLKGKWRMPTVQEIEELRDYCDWENVSTGGRQSIKGTSWKTGECIILPAGGSWQTGYSVELISSEGSEKTAKTVSFTVHNDGFVGDKTTHLVERYHGFYIRPVYDPSADDFVAVSSISLNKTEITLKKGEITTLVATVKPDNATDKTILWDSPDQVIAFVDKTGNVTAGEEGSVVIRAYVCGKTATCTVKVIIPVESISLNKSEVKLIEGESETLLASVKPDNATDKTVIWTSSTPSVATVDSEGKVTAITAGTTTIKAQAGEHYSICTVTVNAREVPISSIELNHTHFYLSEGETENLFVTIKPDDATNKSVIWESNARDIVSVDQNGKITAISIGEAKITVRAGQLSASCSVIVRNPPEGSVDLGLSVFWATCNIGASKPEELGDHFAWGEVETKQSYTMSNYKWWDESTNTLIKYNTSMSQGTVDNKVVLDKADDVAHIQLGGGWRMPTEEELKELKNSCTWTWTDTNGVKGYLVSGKMTNKSIFLPAAGYWRNSLLLSGRGGSYWSSSLDKNSPRYAWSLIFDSSGNGINWNGRDYGYSIRPVSK